MITLSLEGISNINLPNQLPYPLNVDSLNSNTCFCSRLYGSLLTKEARFFFYQKTQICECHAVSNHLKKTVALQRITLLHTIIWRLRNCIT